MAEIPEPKISVIFPDPQLSADVKVILYKPRIKLSTIDTFGLA